MGYLAYVLINLEMSDVQEFGYHFNPIYKISCVLTLWNVKQEDFTKLISYVLSCVFEFLFWLNSIKAKAIKRSNISYLLRYLRSHVHFQEKKNKFCYVTIIIHLSNYVSCFKFKQSKLLGTMSPNPIVVIVIKQK